MVARIAVLMLTLALAANPATAQLVEFQGIPTVDEVLQTLAPEAAPSSMMRTAGPQTPRTIRETGTNADLTAGAAPKPPNAAPNAAPAPNATSAPRPTRPTRPIGISQPTSFAPGSAVLPIAVKRMLDVIAEAMKTVPALSIVITGHTDASGGPAINDPLSQHRADAARDYMAGRGVPAARIVTVGYGARMPLARLGSGDPANRRIQYLRLPVAG